MVKTSLPTTGRRSSFNTFRGSISGRRWAVLLLGSLSLLSPPSNDPASLLAPRVFFASAAPASEDDGGGGGPSLYDGSSSSLVRTFATKSDWLDTVPVSKSPWIVQFYSSSCGECMAFVPVFSEAARILEGVVNLGAVNVGDKNNDFAQRIAEKYKVKSFPTTLAFPADGGKSVTKLEMDPNKDKNLNLLVNFALQRITETVQKRADGSHKSPYGKGRGGNSGGGGGIPETRVDSEVVELTESTFASKVLDDEKNVWLVAFVAPWCGHCKSLLPEWHDASTKLKGTGAMLGTVDATVAKSLASTFGVEGFPTIKVFPGGAKTSASAIDYEGGRIASQIVKSALDEVDRSGVPKEILELISQSILDETCTGKSKICVLVALPHILDSGADGRNKYLDTISALAKSFRGRPFDFLWFEGGDAQLGLESSLELTFGYPAVVAVSLEKDVYTVQRGSFSERSIGSFLNGIVNGRVGTAKLPSPLEVITVDYPWDGKDGEAIEEESLADIMGDDWEL